MLLAALAAGIASEGCDVVDCGVIPTPGLAWLAGERGVPAAMVSASHNPYPDNGIKLFGAGGSKLSFEDEAVIGAELTRADRSPLPAAGRVGQIWVESDAPDSYAERLATAVPAAAGFSGRIVVDCANGAASVVAPVVFDRLGLDHSLINAAPDGTNINAGCGSTDLALLQRAVASSGASLGIAFDGDADRMLAVDETGEVVDGDQLIALFAADLHERGQLVGGHVVVSVLSNLGLRLALGQRGLSVVETPVGDRHISDALETGGYVLGGEQSGHVIFRQHASTGDGVLTALKLIDLLARRSEPLSDLASAAMRRLPQVMVNVPVRDQHRLAGAAAVWREVAAVEAELGAAGRVLVRPSGTEPAVRVMVEGPTIEGVRAQANRLAAVVERELA
jgi:phosphoglucosamine mutase